MYDYLIITCLPVYYKINLYNRLVESGLKIKVLFVGKYSLDRPPDFIDYDKMLFDYTFLSYYAFELCNSSFIPLIKSVVRIFGTIMRDKYKLLIVSGWNLIPFWISVFLFSPKRKNCLALESNIYDSKHKGLEGFIKRVFLKRVSCVFASGDLHFDLLNALNYNGRAYKTKGVGIMNFSRVGQHNFSETECIKFLYVGRLILIKNVKLLCETFSKLINENGLNISLTLIGEGELFKSLREYESKNIVLKGYINNKELYKYYTSHDVFVLPSLIEPWGLVIEEALFYGVPVIVSNKAGAREFIRDGENGFWFDPCSSADLSDKIVNITNIDLLNKLKKGAKEFDLNKKDLQQINSYHQALSV